MELTIVYDDEPSDYSRLIADHGFSCWIETGKEVILFDTGTKGDILLHNLEACGKDPSRISKIVISHEHYDHNGGLPALLSMLDQVTIYRIDERPCSSKVTSVAVKEPIRIGADILSTGRLLGSPLDEQSLIIEQENGLVVLTGCSHSNVGTILDVAGAHGKVLGLIGGFHGFNAFDVLESLLFICPCHCTAHKKKILTLYPNKSSQCHVGSTFDMDTMIS